MENRNQILKYFSGIALLVWGIYGIIAIFSHWEFEIGEFLEYMLDFELLKYNLSVYFSLVAIFTVLLAGIFILTNKNARNIICVALIFYALDYVCRMVTYLQDGLNEGVFMNLFYALPFILAAILYLPMSANLSKIKKFWFVPVVIDLISWIEPLFRGYELSSINFTNMIIEIAAVSLICYCGFSERNVRVAKVVPEKKSEHKSDCSEDYKIAEIKKFKSLLDSGVITQEEFDEKKKQLLEN